MRVGFVTCQNLPEPDFDEAPLLFGCRNAGLDCTMTAWDGPDDPASVDLLVLRSCWNYHLEPPAFLNWLRRAEQATTVLNPPEVIRWNSDKTYLADLAAKGLPIVPTRWIRRGSGVKVATAAHELGADKVVVKPNVSGGSWKTATFTVREMEDAERFLSGILTDRDAMVQPFLGSVQSTGERSVVWIDGEVTHTVVKRPRFTGEEESVSKAVEPTAVDQELAARAVAAAGNGLLYARTDLMLDDEGKWRISELELFEPSLFLVQHPPALDRFVKAIGTRTGRGIVGHADAT